MSRPYQFSDRDDRVTSPLDRRQQNAPAGPPPSFKTDVHRSKTKKWVEAKSVSYGGDDWDDYDEDDEYDVASAIDERTQPATSSQARSFTTPVPASAQAPQLQRTNSFERGDERRAFSASNFPTSPGPPRSPGPSLHVDTTVPPQQAQPTDSASEYSVRQASAASFAPSTTSDTSANPQSRRDFSPSAMPPPLKTPASALPPRQDSVEVPKRGPLSPTSPTKTPSIIRPSDIYKRMEEERERERRTSLDSSRRSIDSARSQDIASPTKLQEPVRTESPATSSGRRSVSIERPEPRLESGYRMGAPLETVAERKSEYGLPGLPTSGKSATPGFTGLSLPALETESGFGTFWDESSQDKAPGQASQPADTGLQHQQSVGLRSMVNQAFDNSARVSKQDSTRSQAATDSTGITRSDTSGTSDISPIMSRVPSSAASAMRQHAEHGNTPSVIAEEPELDERGRSRASAESTTLANVQPGFRRDLNPPSGTNSPARSPAVEVRKQLHDPVAAELLTGPAFNRVTESSFREADLAATASSSSDKANVPVAALEKAAQDMFVATHDLPEEASSRISRSESPTKGRVADLATKFNEVSDSRRNSVQSRSSVSSWERSPSRSRPSSSHGAKAAERPVAERDISFRPKLPGGFESYASTTDSASPEATRDPSPSKEPSKDVDLTPTTAKHPVEVKNLSRPGSSAGGPMAALAAAGAAMGAAISSAVGSSSGHKDEAKPKRAAGDIFARPLPPDRLESVASTIPPTPPAKDELSREMASPPLSKDLPEPPRLEHRDTAESSDAFESDRIRRDIVRSLSPTQEDKPAPSNLDLPTSRAPNRGSDAIPSAYESYWLGSDDEDELKMSATMLPTFSPAPLTPKPAKLPELTKELPEPVAEKSEATTTLPPPPLSNGPSAPIPTTTTPATQSSTSSSSQSAGFLNQRFSWEMTPADSPGKEGPASVKAPGTNAPKIAIPKTEPANSSKKLKPADPLSLNPKLSSEHLQIRNAEPGELPSPEEARPSLDSIKETTTPARGGEEPVSPVYDMSGGLRPSSLDAPPRETPAGPRPPSSHKPHDPNDVRPPSFREILAIKSTTARIAKYNETRMQFANMNTGLEYWLRRTATANPQLREIDTLVHRSSIQVAATTSPSSIRHRATGSLTKVFSGQGDRLTAPIDSTPELRPSPSPSDRPLAPTLKGKELLSKATVLGGKMGKTGLKEAKGLFAKGKSRFRSSGSEKAPSETSSRRSSIASSISSQSSVFSSVSSRRSSLDTTPDSSRRGSLDPTFVSLCRSSSSSSHNNDRILQSKKLPPDDLDPPWSDDWLREQADITVMAIFSRLKRTAEDDETARNTRLNAGRPQTPRKPDENGTQTSNIPSPALPNFNFEGSRPSSRNGDWNASSDNLTVMKGGGGIMKNASANASMSALATLPSRQAMGGSSTSLTIPDLHSGKAGNRKNSHPRIVGVLGPNEESAASADEHDDDDPPSPVSPVEEEDKFPDGPLPIVGKDIMPARPGAKRSAYSAPRGTGIPTSGLKLGLGVPGMSPMLRPQGTAGVMDTEPHSRVPFVANEPKGKEKAMSGSSTPVITSARHIRFDSSTFHPRAKEIKLQKAKQAAEEAARRGTSPNAGRKQYSPPMPGGTPPQISHFQQAVQNSAKPGTTPQQKRANPESGALTGLHRADSQFDRMAAIANAHKMMREQFDDLNDVSQAPPDLMATETAARMHARQQELDRMSIVMSGGLGGIPIPPIPESRPQSSHGRPGSSHGRPGSSHGHSRSRASSGTSFADAARSRSRESRPVNSVAFGGATSTPGYSTEPSGARATSMPRLPPTGGPRANSIPRPESIVGAPSNRDSRRLSLTNGGPGARDGLPSIGLAIPPAILSVSQGSSPATPVMVVSGGMTPITPSSGLSSLPSQQRPVSHIAAIVNETSQPSPRLSMGPGPTLHEEPEPQPQAKPAAMAPVMPSMVITTPELVSTPQAASPPRTITPSALKNQKLGPQPSIGGQSQHSVSSLGDVTDQSGNVSPANSKRPVSPVMKTFEGRQYHAPDPKKERPMSFVPSARDDRGYVSEVISTAKNPIDVTTPEAEEPPETIASASRSNEPAKQSRKMWDHLRNQQRATPPVEAARTISAQSNHSHDQPMQRIASSLEPSRTVSAQSDYEDDLYKLPTPKRASNQSMASAQLTSEPPREASISPLHSNPVRQRSVQLYDRPFSRDDAASKASEECTAPPVPDMNPIAHLQSGSATVAKKKGLFAKVKSQPQAAGSAAGSGHSQQSSRDTTSSIEQQRLSSMTSTTASSEVIVKDKRRRGSGFWSMKRPSTESMSTQIKVDDTVVPPHNQVRLSFGDGVAASPTGGQVLAPQRSATTHAGTPVKKRRGTLGGIFSRATSTNTTQSPPPLPPKQSAKATVFHRVPTNHAWQAQQDYQKAQKSSGPRGEEPGQLPRPPSFVHNPGASGMAAIEAQQQGAQITTTITSGGHKDRRSMSISGVFGRKRADSSPSSRGRDRSNSTDSQTKPKKIRKRNMGSISETTIGQHQERPWAIQFPGAEDNEDDKELERREIMHASSVRWQRGPDGQMYAEQEQTSPASPTGSTPISPQPQPPPGQPTQNTPANQVFSYLPTGGPTQQPTAAEDRTQPAQDYYSPRTHSPPVEHPQQQNKYAGPEKPESYQPTAAPSQPIIPPLPQGDVPLMQPQPRRTSWQGGVNDPRMDPSYRSSGASRSTTTTTRSPTSSHVVTSQKPGGPPRLDVPRIPLDLVPGTAPGGYFPNRAVGSDRQAEDDLSSPIGRERDAPENRPPAPPKDTPRSIQRNASSSSADPDHSAEANRNFVATLEEERRKHGEHTAMGYSGSKAKRERAGLHVNVPMISGAPPPQVGMFEDTTAAIASTSAGTRRGRKRPEHEDSPIVMKATSFPGDEWNPFEYYAE